MEKNKTMLKNITFSEIINWDVKNFFRQVNVFKEGIRIVPFGFFLSKSDVEKIKIEDENEYKVLGVRSYGKGAFINREVMGDTLKMRTYQLAKKNRLFWCKVDTKNGAFGIINDSFVNGIASSNMTFADINTNEANLEFIQTLFKSKKINEYMDGYVTGTTNRKYIKPDQLREEIKIPLPFITAQNKIVDSYNTKMVLAKQQETKATDLEKEIEVYLDDALGLKKLKEKEIVKGLQFISLKNLDRWDVLTKDLRTLNGLSNSKYDLKKIGSIYDFPSKSWKKKEYKKETFKYIELGAIEENFGVKRVKEIEVKKAPSRATQQINTGDLIIGTTRPYLKRFAIINTKHDNNICSSGFSIIEPSPNYDLNFLKEFLMSFYGIEQLKNRMTGGTYPAITNTELKEILIPLPKIATQKEIGNHILNLKNEIKNLKKEAKQNREQAILDFENEIFN